MIRNLPFLLLFVTTPASAQQRTFTSDSLTPSTAPKNPDSIQVAATPDAVPLPRPQGWNWDFSAFGFLRLGYDYTAKDARYDFVGRNNGFVLDSARIAIQGLNTDYRLLFRISIEGADNALTAPNTPQGTLAVRLRDAFLRWDPLPFLGFQAGQFKAPWQAEELRNIPDLMFASRAVGVDGVLAGRGFATPGIQLDRQLGVMISPPEPIGTKNFGAMYYVMVMNGAGANQFLDDNGRVGIVARGELSGKTDAGDGATIGAGVFRNDRTVGTLPNLYNEEDLGLTGDLDVRFRGAEIFGAVTRLRTAFPTVGTAERVQLAYHVQAAYRFDIRNSFFLAPGYRIATFNPWQSGGSDGFDNFRLVYHTFGVRAGHAKLPVQAWLNYTITEEQAGRKLSNNRVELMSQVSF